MTPAFLQFLESYEWPGNLDELQETLGEAHSRCRKEELDVGDIPPALRAAAERAVIPPAAEPKPLPLDQLLADAERRLIQLALSQARGNLSKAAARLAISRPRLYRRMHQLGLVEAAQAPPPDNPDGETP
jgi:DNA-binding NtrC family response regulator